MEKKKLIGNRYQILKQIAEGGAGRIYLAQDI